MNENKLAFGPLKLRMVMPYGQLKDEYWVFTESGWAAIKLGEDGKVVIAPASGLPPLLNPETADLLIHMPPSLEDYTILGEFDDIFEAVLTYLKNYVVVKEVDYYKLATYAILSHAHHAFRYFPVLLIKKYGYSKGGSVTARVVADLMPRPTKNLVGPTAAAMMWLIDRVKPTMVVDEAGRRELPEELRAQYTLLIEAAYYAENERIKLEGDTLISTNYYTPVVIVDTQDVYNNLSTERRAIPVVLNRAPIATDEEEARREALELAPRLYKLGLELSLKMQGEIKEAARHQGLGPFYALLRFLSKTGVAKTKEYVARAFAAIKDELNAAYEAAKATDPQERIGGLLNEAIEVVKSKIPEWAQGGSLPSGFKPSDKENCIYMSVSTLATKLKDLFYEAYQRDVKVAAGEDYTLEDMLFADNKGGVVRRWERLPDDVRPFLTEKYLINRLRHEFGLNVERIDGRHAYVKICI